MNTKIITKHFRKEIKPEIVLTKTSQDYYLRVNETSIINEKKNAYDLGKHEKKVLKIGKKYIHSLPFERKGVKGITHFVRVDYLNALIIVLNNKGYVCKV